MSLTSEEVDVLSVKAVEAIEQLLGRITELEISERQLREALKRIASTEGDEDPDEDRAAMQRIAHAALKQKKAA